MVNVTGLIRSGDKVLLIIYGIEDRVRQNRGGERLSS